MKMPPMIGFVVLSFLPGLSIYLYKFSVSLFACCYSSVRHPALIPGQVRLAHASRTCFSDSWIVRKHDHDAPLLWNHVVITCGHKRLSNHDVLMTGKHDRSGLCSLSNMKSSLPCERLSIFTWFENACLRTTRVRFRRKPFLQPSLRYYAWRQTNMCNPGRVVGLVLTDSNGAFVNNNVEVVY
jgi:hypothetical protein